jgi:hypothetical protein
MRGIYYTIEEPRAFVDGFYQSLSNMGSEAVPGV